MAINPFKNCIFLAAAVLFLSTPLEVFAERWSSSSSGSPPPPRTIIADMGECAAEGVPSKNVGLTGGKEIQSGPLKFSVTDFGADRRVPLITFSINPTTFECEVSPGFFSEVLDTCACWRELDEGLQHLNANASNPCVPYDVLSAVHQLAIEKGC